MNEYTFRFRGLTIITFQSGLFEFTQDFVRCRFVLGDEQLIENWINNCLNGKPENKELN